jgi:hypothetical protein
MVRPLSAIAAGLATAIVTIMAVEAIGYQLYPPPDGFNMANPSAELLPFESLLFPVVGWFLGALAGGWLAIRLSGERWTAWVIAAFVLAATILNLALITHPLWMIVAGSLASPLGGGTAQWISKGPARPS